MSLDTFFISNEFNPDQFVKDLSSQCIGADELRLQRAKIQELASNTSALLKRNVYQNYTQFIETAKEISHLESEMYQLSQLLSEQRSLLNSISANNSTGITLDNNSEIDKRNCSLLQIKEDSKFKLTQLLENVEGATNLIDTPGRICLHDGFLLELDPLDSRPLQRIHAYLFNDVLMLASWLNNSNRKGSPRYKVQVIYDLQSLAVVNIKDLGTIKFAFKLLAFPDTRVFQCSTATNKKEWLEKCEQVKKSRIPQEKGLKLSNRNASTKNEISSLHNQLQKCKPSLFEFPNVLPEWLIEIIEDLDSCIAQRHFEDAYNLLQKANEFFNTVEDNQDLNSVKFNLNNRTNNLVSILTKELELLAESKSLQGGGYRSAKRPVKLLIQLNHSTQACQLYLILCSATMKARLKKVKREGLTTCYVKELSSIAFSNFVEISREFLSLFPFTSKCQSVFLVWCSHELKILTSHLSKQMFLPQVPLNALAECVITIRTHCEQLTSIGIDFQHQNDVQLRKTLIKIFEEVNEKYVDATKIRAAEDNLKPINLETHQNLCKLSSELESLGIPIQEYIDKNMCSIPLTSNTLTFSKLYIGLVEDCLNLYVPEIIIIIEDTLVGVLQTQIQHLQGSLINSKIKQEIILIQNNIQYINNVVIDRTLELYESVVGYQFIKLKILRRQLNYESRNLLIKPQPAPRNSVTKYSTTEYI